MSKNNPEETSKVSDRSGPCDSEDRSTPPPERIADLHEDERPREKLLRLGPKALSDAELLAIFFRSGTKAQTPWKSGEIFWEATDHFKNCRASK
ncbi:MAG: UPF0758 domain-containing protein [Verrucomicrobiota bacterium]